MEFCAVCTILSTISTLTAFLPCAVPVINPLALHNTGDAAHIDQSAGDAHRTLTELLDANPMPEIARDRKDGSAVESAEQQNKRERTWDLNEGYTAEKTE